MAAAIDESRSSFSIFFLSRICAGGFQRQVSSPRFRNTHTARLKGSLQQSCLAPSEEVDNRRIHVLGVYRTYYCQKLIYLLYRLMYPLLALTAGLSSEHRNCSAAMREGHESNKPAFGVQPGLRFGTDDPFRGPCYVCGPGVL